MIVGRSQIGSMTSFLGMVTQGKTHPEVDAPRHCTIDFNDTFIDTEHICESFPGRKITFTGSCESSRHAFKVIFSEGGSSSEALRTEWFWTLL